MNKLITHFSRVKREDKIIALFVILKLLIHFLTNTNYELHRDAYLYISLADHPAWGYASIPPLLPFLVKGVRFFFGDSIFIMRLIPTVVGALSIFIIGMMVKRLGGGLWAIVLACTSFLLSLAFLRSNTLLQPVSLNQFFWLLFLYLGLRLIQTQDMKRWLWIGVVVGFAFLNKYSIAFIVAGFLIALIISPQRKLLISRYVLFAVVLGFLIIFPNLLWQYNHNWPVVLHMEELQQNQLVNVSIRGFLTAQLFMNINVLPVWLAGLLFLLFHPLAQEYRTIGFTFIFTVLILVLLHGKAYYTLGLYTSLFAAGGWAIEKYTREHAKVVSLSIIGILFIITIPVLPYSLPLLPINSMVTYARESKKWGGENALYWEDGRVHSLPQDYADMTGWKELADKVYSAFISLPLDDQEHCSIYAENYGLAGAILYYDHKKGLPEPVSFSDSFLLWAPDSMRDNILIYVNDDSTQLRELFKNVKCIGSITTPDAREYGVGLFLCRQPQDVMKSFYANKVRELKSIYRR